MKIYLHNGEAIDDGRIARSFQEHEGWHSGKPVEGRDSPKHMSWTAIAAVAGLCLLLIYICTTFAAEKPHCDLACRDLNGMTTTLSTPKEQ